MSRFVISSKLDGPERKKPCPLWWTRLSLVDYMSEISNLDLAKDMAEFVNSIAFTSTADVDMIN